MKKFRLKIFIPIIFSFVFYMGTTGVRALGICELDGGVASVYPDLTQVCWNESVRQTYTCGDGLKEISSKSVSGKKPAQAWSPSDSSSVYFRTKFSQSSICDTQFSYGTKPIVWMPQPSEVLSGKSFHQVDISGASKFAIGTKPVSATFPSPSQVCSGVKVDSYNECGRSSLITGTKDCSAACIADGSQTPNSGDIIAGVSFSAVDNCGKIIKTSSGAIKAFTGTKPSVWLPSTSEVGRGITFAQVNVCGKQKSAGGIKVDAGYAPDVSSFCNGDLVQQVNEWGKTKTSTGTLDLIPWYSPYSAANYCVGKSFTQTNGCTTRLRNGTNQGYFSPRPSTVCKGVEFTQRQVCTGETRTEIGTNTNCPPSVTLTANPNSINAGGSVSLEWTADASGCTASGGWSGSKSVNGGLESVSPSESTTYTITCSKSGYPNVSSSVTVTVAAPSVEITATPSAITSGDYTDIFWNSVNADYCWATGGMSGWTDTWKSVTGSESYNPSSATSFGVECWNAAGISSGLKTVDVTTSCTPTYDNYRCNLFELNVCDESNAGRTITAKTARCGRDVNNGCTEGITLPSKNDCSDNGVSCPEDVQITCPSSVTAKGWREVAP